MIICSFLKPRFRVVKNRVRWKHMSGGGRAAIRVVQGMKDHVVVTKYGGDHSAGIKTLKDTACGGDVGGSMHARRFSGVDDSCALKAAKADEKLKQAEESLRTVMYLSCWGPT